MSINTKVVYIAHQIGGDVGANMKSIAEIGRDINLTEPDTIPFAPYFYDLACLSDTEPKERKRGMDNNLHILNSFPIDEVRLYGPRISDGMKTECVVARLNGIDIISMNEHTKFTIEEILNWTDEYRKSI